MKLHCALAFVFLAACGSPAVVGGGTVTEDFAAPQDDFDLASMPPFQPKFEPDFNRLEPQPEVEVTTDSERDNADVFPDRLELPDSMSSVATWQPGRLVVAAASQGTGKNPMGFARRVTKVEHVGDRYIVSTVTVGIEEVVQGDFQVEFTAENSQPMDMAKLDLDWAAQNLYGNNPSMVNELVLMPSNSPPSQTPLGFWDGVIDFFDTIGDATIDLAVGTWDKIKAGGEKFWKFVTTGTFEGAVNFGPNMSFEQDSDESLWPAKDLGIDVLSLFEKTLRTKSGTGVKLGLDGKISYRAAAWFDPGIQVYGRFSVVEEPKLGVNLHSRAGVQLKFDVDLTASVSSDSYKSLDELNKAKNPLVGEIKNLAKDAFLSGDSATAAPYKLVLFVSKPQVKWIQAGPVPIAITVTMQFDLECSFQVRANVKAHADFEESAELKFGIEFTPSKGAEITQLPALTFKRKHDFTFDKFAGAIEATCGIVPRANVMLYDSIGAFAAVFGGVHATGTYTDDCGTGTRNEEGSPDAVLGAKLAARLAVTIGGTKQPPGTSLLSASQQGKMRSDIIRKDVFTKEWPLLSRTWRKQSAGLGWCPITCPNGKKDGDESDLDCGGSCAAKCSLGETCKVNSECDTGICNKGKCSNDPCGDNVQDALESDIDCGGPATACAPCVEGKRCRSSLDCATSACSGANEMPPRVCVVDHCHNRIQDRDEGGVDCSGVTCAKCNNGVRATSAADCASGYFNGTICVGASCEDHVKNGDETDVDCGGSCPNKCGFLRGCNVNGDCGATAEVCRATKLSNHGVAQKVCIRTADSTHTCSQTIPTPTDSCASNVCKPLQGGLLRCEAPTCTDGVKNGNEPATDCGAVSTTGCEYKCLCGQRCNTSADCDDACNGCNSGICGGAKDACSNNFRDANETDVDCGGNCEACGLYNKCNTNSDCSLGNCAGGTCTLPPGGLAAAWGLHRDGSNALGGSYPPIFFVISSIGGVMPGPFASESHNGMGGSASFDGLNTRGDLGEPFTLADRFTITAWIKPDTNLSRRTIVGSQTDLSTDGFAFMVGDGGTLRLQTGNGGSTGIRETGPDAVAVDTWQHVAVTGDRIAGSVIFYVNGQAVAASGGFVETFANTGLSLRFGRQAGTLGEIYFSGLMEDVRIYGTALTPAQLVTLKNQ